VRILHLRSRESPFDVEIQSNQREDDADWRRVDGGRLLRDVGVHYVPEDEAFRPIV
jgi:hypothetical protein